MHSSCEDADTQTSRCCALIPSSETSSRKAPRRYAVLRICSWTACQRQTDHQAFVLSQAVHAYAENIHDLTPLLPVVQRIAYKHASLHITPEQYAIVGRHLIQAIVDVLGEAVTPAIGDAWTRGYWNLAKVGHKDVSGCQS